VRASAPSAAADVAVPVGWSLVDDGVAVGDGAAPDPLTPTDDGGSGGPDRFVDVVDVDVDVDVVDVVDVAVL
jgi:hypothetical protein